MLVLLLGAIPVALPVMFTASMAVGARELTQKGVLVTRLSASEDAATMNVLCVDKTGTITMNRLSVANVVPLDGFGERERKSLNSIPTLLTKLKSYPTHAVILAWAF